MWESNQGSCGLSRTITDLGQPHMRSDFVPASSIISSSAACATAPPLSRQVLYVLIFIKKYSLTVRHSPAHKRATGFIHRGNLSRHILKTGRS
ncbi:hypothetical protein CHARACLAT_012830 [Characodon lateralis]|uniref:Uncharacterized protein n=1 Tax=Characodon lateralis TaxID=208331 RepID=A0ABU7EK91_9TELE|nr:hypothetical protein [Characodon lateralis]